MTGFMILEYTFKNNAFAELVGPNIKYWQGQGLPDYEGAIEGFEKEYPMQFAELLKNKVIKAN